MRSWRSVPELQLLELLLLSSPPKHWTFPGLRPPRVLRQGPAQDRGRHGLLGLNELGFGYKLTSGYYLVAVKMVAS